MRNDGVVRVMRTKRGSHGFGGCGGRGGREGAVALKKRGVLFSYQRPLWGEIEIDISWDSHLAVRIERLICRDLEFAQLRRGHRPVL